MTQEIFSFQIAVQKKDGDPEHYIVRAKNAINALLNAQAYFNEKKEPVAIVAIFPTDIVGFIPDGEPVQKVEDGQEKSEDLTIVS